MSSPKTLTEKDHEWVSAPDGSWHLMTVPLKAITSKRQAVIAVAAYSVTNVMYIWKSQHQDYPNHFGWSFDLQQAKREALAVARSVVLAKKPASASRKTASRKPLSRKKGR